MLTKYIIHLAPVNSRVPKTVRHGTSLHRVCLKLWIESSPSQLESQTSVRQPTVKIFGSSPIRLEYQTSVRQHRWELPGNYPVFTVVMVIYHYVERIWRILVTPIFLYKIYDH